MRQEVAGVGVVDQHGHRADHHGQVHKVLPAEATSDLGLVAGAAEHHRHVDGRVEEERPGLQGERGGDEEEEEEEEEEERRPGGGRRVSPGNGHVGSLLPGKEGGKNEGKGGEGGNERKESDSQTYKLLYFYDIFDIIHDNPSVHIHPPTPLSCSVSLADPFV